MFAVRFTIWRSNDAPLEGVGETLGRIFPGMGGSEQAEENASRFGRWFR